MKITPVDGMDLQDLETLAIMVRLIPWEGEFIPHFMMMSQEERPEDCNVTVMELAALQEGLYHAANRLDEMIRGLFAALKMEQLQEFKKLSEMIEDMDRHYYNEEPPSEEDECG
jgi:hypothetical protein